MIASPTRTISRSLFTGVLEFPIGMKLLCMQEAGVQIQGRAGMHYFTVSDATEPLMQQCELHNQVGKNVLPFASPRRILIITVRIERRLSPTPGRRCCILDEPGSVGCYAVACRVIQGDREPHAGAATWGSSSGSRVRA